MTRYRLSEELLERALRTIPLASQTFSKSLTQFPRGASPFFLSKGAGAQVWDVDGNEYVDFINGLAAINLGYGDPDVQLAVQEQLEAGVIFSLPHVLEMQVAEKLVEMVPCAEMVRFGKNGSDATAGAIRLARAFTGREHVAVCGYHGWQDWYIGSTARNLGVPQSVRALTHAFTYNDADSLKAIFDAWPDQVAAVILEPMNTTMPAEGFLESVRAMASAHGAVLIFDETITGFRFANGGAQEYFEVLPDLATFGKGMANGFPLSAVVGRRDIMRMMEDIFFSSTFGGETLSLAAALATMSKLQREPVVQTLWSRGSRLLAQAQALADHHGVGHFLSFSGHPAWSFIQIRDVSPYTHWQLRTLFIQEMLDRGILIAGAHVMSFAHSEADVDTLLRAYEEVLPNLREAVEQGTLESKLRCKPLEPLFRVR